MNLSAASSSDFVVVPGRATERSIRRQRAWISPAAAIASICSEVFRTIIPRYMIPFLSHPLLFLAAERRDDRMDPLLDLIRRLAAVDAIEDPPILVIVDQQLGLLPVLSEPVLDHLRLVVLADDQPAAVDVTDPLLLGWVEIDVVDVARVLLAGAPPAEPADDFLLRDLDQQRRGHLAMELSHLRFERLRLGHRPGKAVEDEPVGGLLLLQPLRDHADDHLVGGQVAPVHVLLRLLADLGALLDGGAEDVAGRVIGEAEVLLKALPLGPLPAARRPEQNEVQFGQARHPAARITSGSPRSCASSAGPRAASRYREPRRRRSGSRSHRRRSLPTSERSGSSAAPRPRPDRARPG